MMLGMLPMLVHLYGEGVSPSLLSEGDGIGFGFHDTIDVRDTAYLFAWHGVVTYLVAFDTVD